MKITRGRGNPSAGGMLFSGGYATKYAAICMMTGLCSSSPLPEKTRTVESLLAKRHVTTASGRSHFFPSPQPVGKKTVSSQNPSGSGALYIGTRLRWKEKNAQTVYAIIFLKASKPEKILFL